MTHEQKIVFLIIAALVSTGYVVLRLSLFRRCGHLTTRCLHGDEITHRMKVYAIRFWKPEVIRRQVCLECGAALDRSAICAATGENLHEWEGPWPYDERLEQSERLL